MGEGERRSRGNYEQKIHLVARPLARSLGCTKRSKHVSNNKRWRKVEGGSTGRSRKVVVVYVDQRISTRWDSHLKTLERMEVSIGNRDK